MPPSKTRTIKNKNAGPSKKSVASSSDGPGGGGAKRKSSGGKKGPVTAVQLKEKTRQALLQKPKKKVYTEKELNIPTLNMITPVGVTKPKGKKKGKVFVDDKVRTSLEMRDYVSNPFDRRA